MLLLNQAFINPMTVGMMNETTAEYDCQAFPVEILNEQNHIEIHEKKIKFICSKIICDAGFRTGRLGVVITDNTAIHILNREFCKHDYPTDVMGFPLEYSDSLMEAELVVSAEMAKDRCEEFGLTGEAELLLYVIHGTLHLVGFDDQTENDTYVMRIMEAKYLALLGITIPEDED